MPGMIKEPALLPCPLCGYEAFWAYVSSKPEIWCGRPSSFPGTGNAGCGLQLVGSQYDSPKTMADRWNHRSSDNQVA